MATREGPVPGVCAIELAFEQNRRMLWQLAYRITGCASEADDVAQETFARALEHPPEDRGAPLRPWLVRVATHLAIDALRRRRRRGYPGVWLPTPVETGDLLGEIDAGDARACPETRYGMLESVSFAFLLALEALCPRQRAVLVLRDVLDYSARETAQILGTTEPNVRIVHHRARRALEAYDATSRPAGGALAERTRRTLAAFVRCLAEQDAPALEALLIEDVRTATDAGGEYTALRAPLAGRAAVARLYLRAALQRRAGAPRITVRSVNGLPALLIELGTPVRRQAPLALLRIDLAGDGRIREIHSILAPRKLEALRPRPA